MQTHVNASSPQTRRHRWLAAVAALVLTVSPALAGDHDGEPFNNTPPWDILAAYQPHTAYIGQSGYSIHGSFAITSARTLRSGCGS